MNNSELDSVLKKAKVPQRPAEFWEQLPQQVAGRLGQSQTPNNWAQRPSFPRWAWGFASAACVLIAFATIHRLAPSESRDVLTSAGLINGMLALFPHRVRAIVQDERGLSLVLSEQGDVPASTPLYVRICDGKNCSSLVTFSGQEIEIAGQKLTVLSDAHGGIILEGKKWLWSNTEAIYAGSHLKIEAHNLVLLPM